MASRKELKESKKQERLAAEQAQKEKEQKEKRLRALGLVIALATFVVIAVVVISTSGGKDNPVDTTKTPNGAAEVSRLLRGIVQSGETLGNPNAPFHMVEFADLKCPVCRMFDVSVMPGVIDKYVRTGKLKVDLKLLKFVGEDLQDGTPGFTPGDSPAAAKFAVATQQQNRYWNFAELFYFNQRDEKERYAGTNPFLGWISKAAGVDSRKAFADQKSPKVQKKLAEYDREFAAIGGTGTPTVLLGKRGEKLETVDLQKLGVDNQEAFLAFLREKIGD